MDFRIAFPIPIKTQLLWLPMKGDTLFLCCSFYAGMILDNQLQR